MTTCRAIINDALRMLKLLAPGDMAHVDQLTAGLAALQNLAVEFAEARGPLTDVDVAADYVANQNQRVRVEAGDTITVTLPNSIPVWPAHDPADYGFSGGSALPNPGSIAVADGASYRQPDDGAVVEIVGTTQGLYFYRADINAWISAYNLALDDEAPFNQRYAGPLGAMTAERLMDELAVNEPSPGLARRIANARAVMFTRPGTRRAPVRGEYL